MAGGGGELVDGRGVAEREALEQDADQRGGVGGDGLAGLGAELADPRRQVARAQEALVVGVDERRERGGRLGERRRASRRSGPPGPATARGGSPGPATAPRRCAAAGWCRRRRPRWSGSRPASRREMTGCGTSSPISDQVPDERYAVDAGGERRAHDGRRRVVRARAGRRARRARPGASARAPREAADVRARARRSRAAAAVGMPRRSSIGRAQSRATGVEGLAGGRERVLGDAGAGQEVGEQVGHHQQPVGVPQQRIVRARHREQLVERC